MKKVKTFNRFVDGIDHIEQHNIEMKTIRLCQDKLVESVDGEQLPKVAIDILVNIMGFVYEGGDLLVADYMNKRKDPIYKSIDKHSAYYLATTEEIKSNLEHFCSYYLLDDGEVSLIDGEVQFPDYDNGTYFDENITDIGLALWILEQLGYTYPCVVLYKDKKDKDYIKMFDTDTFIEATIKLKQYIDRKGIDKAWCRIDNVNITGKMGIIIVPKI